MPGNTGGSTPDERPYTKSDIDALDAPARAVFTAIARQSGALDNDTTGEGNTNDKPTTRTVREATGLGRDKVNYRFRVLAGEAASGCDPALIKTTLPPVREDGQMPPKQIELTQAGKAVIRDGVLDQEVAPDMPDWINSESAPEQIKTIAKKVDTLSKQVQHTKFTLDIIARHLGFKTSEELGEKQGETLPRASVLNDPERAGEFVGRDDSIIDILAIMYQGHAALETEIENLGGSPQDSFVPPDEVTDLNGGDSNDD